MNTTEILLALARVFIIIIPGFIFSRRGLLSDEQCRGISTIVMNLTWPCLVIDALQVPYSAEYLKNTILMALAICLALAVSWAIALLAEKFLRFGERAKYVFFFMMLFPNTGFMGIPIAEAIYGKEGIFYSALLDSAMNIFIFTAGTLLIKKSSGAGGGRVRMKDIVTPGLVSIIIGFALFVLDIRLPEFLGETITTIGAATTPLAMLIIGIYLGKTDLKSLFGDRRLYALSLLRLLVIPLVFMLPCVLLMDGAGVFVKLLIMELGMPVATCTVIFVQEYRGDPVLAAKGVVLSTLMSIVTIPAVVIMLESLL